MIISDGALLGMIEGAADASPREACGLLWSAGPGEPVSGVVELANVADRPERAFAADPGEQAEVVGWVRSVGGVVVGAWHSHPSGKAGPSSGDVAAHDPRLLMAIIGLGVWKPVRVGVWRVVDGAAVDAGDVDVPGVVGDWPVVRSRLR